MDRYVRCRQERNLVQAPTRDFYRTENNFSHKTASRDIYYNKTKRKRGKNVKKYVRIGAAKQRKAYSSRQFRPRLLFSFPISRYCSTMQEIGRRVHIRKYKNCGTAARLSKRGNDYRFMVIDTNVVESNFTQEI